MDILLLYVFTRIDVVGTVAMILAILAGAITGGCHLAVVDNYRRENIPIWKTWRKRWASIAGIALGLFILLPTQRDLAMIVGGHLTVRAAQSETARKVYTIIEDLLDAEVAKIAKKRKEESR